MARLPGAGIHQPPPRPAQQNAPGGLTGGVSKQKKEPLLFAGLRAGRGLAQQAGHLGLQRERGSMVGGGLDGRGLQGGVLGFKGINLSLLLLHGLHQRHHKLRIGQAVAVAGAGTPLKR